MVTVHIQSLCNFALYLLFLDHDSLPLRRVPVLDVLAVVLLIRSMNLLLSTLCYMRQHIYIEYVDELERIMDL